MIIRMTPYNAVHASKMMTASREYVRETQEIPNPKRNPEWSDTLLNKVLKDLMGLSKQKWAYFRKLALKGNFVLRCLTVL